MKCILSCLLALTLVLGAREPAGAQAIVSTGQSFVEPALLVGARNPDGAREAGLELRVRDGWKTYWRSPGQAGVAPEFDWSRSGNLAAAEVDWPLPEVFDSFGFATVGYSGTVVLPLRLVPKDPSRPMNVVLDLTLGVCRDICIFEEAELSAGIAPDAPGPAAGRIDAAEATVPPIGAAAGVTHASCQVAGAGEEREFSAVVEFDRPLENPHVALEGPEDSWFQKMTTTHHGNRLEIASTLSLASTGAWLDRSGLRITVLDRALAADIRGCSATG